MLHVKEIGISSARLGLKLSHYYDVAQKTCSKFCSPKQSHDAIPHNIDPVPSQTQNSQSWASGTTYERKGSRDCSKGQIKHTCNTSRLLAFMLSLQTIQRSFEAAFRTQCFTRLEHGELTLLCERFNLCKVVHVQNSSFGSRRRQL